MEIEIIIPIVTVLLGAFATAVLGYFFGMRKMRREYRGSIGQEVWKVRKETYAELLGYMKILPLWPTRSGKATFGELQRLSKKFRNWYFGNGGLFLTEVSKRHYFDVQSSIQDLLQRHPDTKEIIDPDIYKAVRKKLSALRTEMTNDLLSRERDLLTSKNEQTTDSGINET